jgi:phage antirepressor YoqD-like protein
MQLLKVDTEVSITLKDLTDLIGVDHSKAMKKVTKLSEEPNFGTLAKIATVYNDKGQTVETYLLTKKQAIAVGAKLNNSLLMLVIDRLEELEKSKQSLSLPQNYIEALEALTVSEKQKLQLTASIEEKNKVILAVANLNIRAGDISFADFAKNMAIKDFGRNHVTSFCKARGYTNDKLEPYQPYVNRGYFVRKPSKDKINGEYRYTTFLTPRGSVWLAKIIRAEFELDEAKSMVDNITLIDLV